MSASRKVSIVGQGYVGLPLAMAAAKAGWKVTGIDVSSRIVDGLIAGLSHVEDVSNSQLQKALDKDLYRATQDGQASSESEICVICVPTPLEQKGLPDLT